MNEELPDVQSGFRKGRETRGQIANICWIIEKAREFQNIYLYFIDYAKAFDWVDLNKLDLVLMGGAMLNISLIQFSVEGWGFNPNFCFLLSLSHSEASISLLSFSIRGQTDYKPQSQKTNQFDHMDHSPV